MRKRLTLLAVVIAPLGILAGVVLGPAATALAYFPANHYTCITNPDSSQPCLQHSFPNITVGTTVGNDDKVTFLQADFGCNNAVVTDTSANGGPCPFTNGSGWNRTFNGDEIGCLHFLNAGGLVGANGPGASAVFRQTCGDTGTFWVVHNNTFVNVHASNLAFANYGATIAQVLCITPGTNQTIVDDWYTGVTGGGCDWGP